MKNIKWLLIIQLLNLTGCFAQNILPVERLVDYILDSNRGLESDNITYVKDVNGVFNKFIGTWKGTHNTRNYELQIFKLTKTFPLGSGIKKDRLYFKYLITESSDGSIIESNMDEPNNSSWIVKGHYINENGTYIFNFWGGKNHCGVDGDLYVQSYSNNDLKIFMAPIGEYQYTCKSQVPFIVFPEEKISFTRVNSVLKN